MEVPMAKDVVSAPVPARERLERRLAEINAEIRAYPQPIARCDAQLGGLVDERAHVRAELEALEGARQAKSMK
jgi:prefoldin subunit 5